MRAATNLRTYLINYSHDHSTEVFQKHNNEINKKIFEQIRFPDVYSKYGAITAIELLVDADTGEEISVKITRFANYLRNVFSCQDSDVIRVTARILGKLTTKSTLGSDLVEFEVKRSIEWISDSRQEARRQAAILEITSIATQSPTLLYAYVGTILDAMPAVLKDPKQAIRVDAAACLHACLDIIQLRDSPVRYQWYTKLLEEARAGVKSTSPDAVHGGLLIFRELLLAAGMFMNPHFSEVCEVILKLKDSKDVVIKRQVIQLFPTCATYNPVEFTKRYLVDSMSFLIGQLKRERDRGIVFVSIGNIAKAVRSNMAFYLEPILENVREGLTMKGRQRKELESPIFECLSLLAHSVGQALAKHISKEVLDLLFACGLSHSLASCLNVFMIYIPPLQDTIRDRVLTMLSLILSGNVFRKPGAPGIAPQMNEQAAREYRDSMLSRDGLSSDMSDEKLLTLALNMLDSFNFKDRSLSEFVKDVTVRYMEHDDPRVRKAAALTTCHIYTRDPISSQVSKHALNRVNFVIEKLLNEAVTDPIPEIRFDILRSFEPKLDPFLSQPENARLLFMALNDEVFAIRLVTIAIIGRLTKSNPSYIIPSLRKTLIQLLTDLENSPSTRTKEESSKLLSALIRSSKSLVKPYVESILRVLIPKAQDGRSSVASSVINAIGALCVIGGEDMKEYIPKLMPLLLETIQPNVAGTRRDAALRTMGQLASSTGYAVKPFLDYPTLLDTIINILKSDVQPPTRREAVRLLGILGALDPYKYREVEQDNEEEKDDRENSPIDIKLLMNGMSPSSDEYYPTVVITTLMSILKEPSLHSHHTSIAQAILFIFKSLGLKCVPFLNQIIPGLLGVMRVSSSTLTEFFFKQLAILVGVVKQHIRVYLDGIFESITFFFSDTTLQSTILELVDAIAKALDGEFKIRIPTLLPFMINVLHKDGSPNFDASRKVLHSFVVFGSNVEEYSHQIVPNVVQLFEEGPISVRIKAIECIGELCRTVNLNDMASRIIQPLLRVIASGNDDIRRASVETLCSLAYQMGGDFTVFIDVINNSLAKSKVQSSTYDALVSKLLNNEPLPQNLNPYRKKDRMREEITSADAPLMKLPVNQQHLKAAWDTSQKSTRDDFHEWLRRFSIELLKESPSHAIRACSGIAAIYNPLAKELFNASFFSVWCELYDAYKEDLVSNISRALVAPNIPPEVLQTLLNLAEFMEHDEKRLPIDIRTLSYYAQKCHAYAKALHYKELEFIEKPSTPTIEYLISINNQLQQSDAAIGILKYAQQNHDLQLKETWYEKLQRWDEALAGYQSREKLDPDSVEITMGKMRCLHALGEWDQLSQLAAERWAEASTDLRRTIAPLAAAASWGLGDYEKMDTYISVMKAESPDRSFFNSVLFIHRNNFEEAKLQIHRARDLLTTELSALVSESYNRAYGVVVRVQMLAELEEIIAYKTVGDDAPEKKTMRDTWMTRLKGCQRNVDIWQRMLKVRALVVKPKEDMDMWIKFANLCRKSNRMGLAEKSLNSLLESDGGENPQASRAPPAVVYAQLKYMWATGNQQEALKHLIAFTSSMSHDLNLHHDDIIAQPLPSERPGATPEIEQYTKLLARCFLKQGEWQVALRPNWKVEDPDSILGSYLLATHFDKGWYKAWHNWALANFDVISMFENKRHERKVNRTHSSLSLADASGSSLSLADHGTHLQPPSDLVTRLVVPAIRGFFHSISLSEQKGLRDSLRLLTLWFNYGGMKEPSVAMNEGFSMVRLEIWLEVVPQLITRIHQPDEVVNTMLHELLTKLGRKHPQALVFPLTVAIKSDSVSRQKAATGILDKVRAYHTELVDQADLVSFELIRVAVLWHEQWHEGLEDAWRYFFVDHNIEKMFATLEPLHKTLAKGPETMREVSFHTSFGRDLHDAYEWALSFKMTNDLAHLNQAWDIYHSVFRRISRQLVQVTSLDSQFVSPKLLAARDLELAVFGTYVPDKPVISIARFDPIFSIISSKQRPRRFTIRGTDGKEYQYLLKGHEDIRQDNLVMQLFGLVNTLLSDDPECFKRHLSIQRYAAIPLSPKSGCLGWVPHSDTFHYLIREYREGKILLNIEHRIMLQMAPYYEHLTHLQKIEVFTYALDNTRGQDLYRVLWLKSRSSEVWLDRRTNYTRSLAVMSMVGYILGLGDRHPSNLMLDRYTGRVIHIDFGDCFEAAILREKFPEKVPFRLTRMLTYAMEVSGIEGSFRITCEHVMELLRSNSESLLAILEAFAYDPLINWGFDIPNQIQQQLAAEDYEKETGLANGDGKSMVDPSEMKRRAQVDDTESSKVDSKQAKIRNQRAHIVLKRIEEKLSGNDFRHSQDLVVSDQVDKLIQQATNIENLCQHFLGWCAYW